MIRILKASCAALLLTAGLAATTAHAASPIDGALFGTWAPKTANGGLAELVLSDDGNGNLLAHGYGQCSPSWCDWGTVQAVVYSTSTTDQYGVVFTAVFNFGFATEVLTGKLTGRNNNGMTIDEYTDFVSTDTRYNYHLSNGLHKIIR